jgi:hypothetical protein
MPLTIGTATARPGEVTTGWFDAVELPTGGHDRFPIIIAQGTTEGPTLWLTTGIHGDEHTGVVTLHRLMNRELAERLSGTVVAVTSLNPSGLRTRQRTPYYLDGDPNRHFPENSGHVHGHGRPEIEVAYKRLFREIEKSQPIALVDLHNAFIGSIPFVFRDPVFYHQRLRFAKGRSRAEADRLQSKVGAMIDAFGFTPINEFVAGSYLKKGLHRSVSGSVLNALSVPAITVELGSWMHIDRGMVEAALVGIHNVLRWAGMLGGELEAITDVPVIKPGYAVRRHMGPACPMAGIIDLVVRPGERVSKGQVLGYLRDITGQPYNDQHGAIRSDHDGFVIGWRHGSARYKGESLMAMAIRDEAELIVPYPD